MARCQPATTARPCVVLACTLHLLGCVTKVATELRWIQEAEHLVTAFQRVERLLGNAWCDCAAGGPFGQMVRQCTRFGVPVQGKLADRSGVE